MEIIIDELPFDPVVEQPIPETPGPVDSVTLAPILTIEPTETPPAVVTEDPTTAVEIPDLVYVAPPELLDPALLPNEPNVIDTWFEEIANQPMSYATFCDYWKDMMSADWKGSDPVVEVPPPVKTDDPLTLAPSVV